MRKTNGGGASPLSLFGHCIHPIGHILKLINNVLKSRKGFTLAEVLITLAIIGIVAAMTLPTLIIKYQKRQVEVKFTKFYSTLSEAVKMSEIDNGPINTWTIFHSLSSSQEMDFQQKFLSYIAPYLKGSKLKYTPNNSAPAYGYAVYASNLKGDRTIEPLVGRYYLVTSDNMILSVAHVNWGSVYPYIRVDLNGKNPPNVFGKDIFQFAFRRKSDGTRVLDCYNFSNYIREQILELDCNKVADNLNNHSCSCLIMMDDWKITDTYPW